MEECVEIAPKRASTHPFQFVSEIAKKPKYVRKPCPHGKHKSYCKEPGCGGAQASVLMRAGAQVVCKEPGCGGASICPHGRERSRARSLAVEVPASVLTGGSAVGARSLAVEVPASVPMENARNGARSLAVEVPASVPVGGGAVSAITATPTSRRARQGAATNAGISSPPSGRLRTEETASALDAKYC